MERQIKGNKKVAQTCATFLFHLDLFLYLKQKRLLEQDEIQVFFDLV